MKWLRLFVLLAAVVAFGCDTRSSGTAGDASDPEMTSDLEPVDEAAEEEAANSAEAGEEASGEEE